MSSEMQRGKGQRKYGSASPSILSAAAAVSIAMIVAISGCSRGGGQPAEPLPPDNFRGTFRDSVVLLDEATAEGLVTIEPGVHRYAPPNNALRIEFKEGDVLVSPKGQGSIQRVTRVIREGDESILETEQATLEDVFSDTDVAGVEDFALSPQDAAQNGISLRQGVTLDLSDPAKWTLRISPDKPVFEDDKFQVFMEGELTYAPRMDFLFQFNFWGLRYLKFGVGGEQTANIEVIVRSRDAGSYAAFEKEMELGSFSLGPKPIYINGVRLLFTPLFTARVGVKGGIRGSMSVKINEDVHLYGGVRYMHYEWQPIAEVSPNFAASPPDLAETKNSSLTAYVKPVVEVGLLGVTVPKCALAAGLKADVDPSLIATPNPWWDLGAIVSVDIGVDIRILTWYSYSYDKTIYNVSSPLCDSNHQCGKRASVDGERLASPTLVKRAPQGP